MAKSLNDLQLKDEVLPGAGEAIPEVSRFTPPPPAGAYRFELPDMTAPIYDIIDASEQGQGQRIKVIFDGDHPLKITQAQEINKAQVGEYFETSLSSVERERGKKGSGIITSDLLLLLSKLGEKDKPATNRKLVEACQKYSHKGFGAEIRYVWICSDRRNIRVPGGDGQLVEVDQKGCNTRYYQEKIEKNPDGSVPYEITCGKCGNVLRAFAQLDNFKA